MLNRLLCKIFGHKVSRHIRILNKLLIIGGIKSTILCERCSKYFTPKIQMPQETIPSKIDNLIEKRIPVLENLSIQEQSITILKNQFREDLESLKQSEKVVEISSKGKDNITFCRTFKCTCGGDMYGVPNYCPNCGAKIKWID